MESMGWTGSGWYHGWCFFAGISIFALNRMIRSTARYGFVPKVRRFGEEFPFLQEYSIFLVLGPAYNRL